MEVLILQIHRERVRRHEDGKSSVCVHAVVEGQGVGAAGQEVPVDRSMVSRAVALIAAIADVGDISQAERGAQVEEYIVVKNDCAAADADRDAGKQLETAQVDEVAGAGAADCNAGQRRIVSKEAGVVFGGAICLQRAGDDLGATCSVLDGRDVRKLTLNTEQRHAGASGGTVRDVDGSGVRGAVREQLYEGFP